jgi:hypothetical protein
MSLTIRERALREIAIKRECETLAQERYNGKRFADLSPTLQSDIWLDAMASVDMAANRQVTR